MTRNISTSAYFFSRTLNTEDLTVSGDNPSTDLGGSRKSGVKIPDGATYQYQHGCLKLKRQELPILDIDEDVYIVGTPVNLKNKNPTLQHQLPPKHPESVG
jgi:hypothetical protein